MSLIGVAVLALASLNALSGGGKQPAWVETKPRPVEGGYQFAVLVGPYETEVECQRELPAKLQEAFSDYVELLKLQYGVHGAVQLELPATVRDAAQRDLHRETLDTAVGPMQRLHVQLVFDEAAAQWIKNRLRESAVADRVWRLGGGVAGLLALVAVAWVWLRR